MHYNTLVVEVLEHPAENVWMMETMTTYFVVDKIPQILFQAVKKGLITWLWRAINFSGLVIRSMEDNLTCGSGKSSTMDSNVGDEVDHSFLVKSPTNTTITATMDKFFFAFACNLLETYAHVELHVNR